MKLSSRFILWVLVGAVLIALLVLTGSNYLLFHSIA
jgi:hypothetical protein